MELDTTGNRLKSLLKYFKITQTELASRLFIDRKIVNNWCNDKILIPPLRAMEISNMFNVSLDWIYGSFKNAQFLEVVESIHIYEALKRVTDIYKWQKENELAKAINNLQHELDVIKGKNAN